MDVVTINVLSGRQLPEALENLQNRLPLLEQRRVEIQPQLEALPQDTPLTNDQKSLVSKAINLAREISLVTGETLTMAYVSAADLALDRLKEGFAGQAYTVSPQLILSLTQTQGEQVRIQLDLRKNDVRVIPAPGQVTKIRNQAVVELPVSQQEIDRSYVSTARILFSSSGSRTSISKNTPVRNVVENARFEKSSW